MISRCLKHKGPGCGQESDATPSESLFFSREALTHQQSSISGRLEARKVAGFGLIRYSSSQVYRFAGSAQAGFGLVETGNGAMG